VARKTRSKKVRNAGATSRRNTQNIANRRLIGSDNTLLGHRVDTSKLGEYSDRRQWTPDKRIHPSFYVGSRNLKTMYRRAKRAIRPSRYTPNPLRLFFRSPNSTLVCVRRKIRREVLHALQRTGRGVKRSRPRLNDNSQISCVRKRRRR